MKRAMRQARLRPANWLCAAAALLISGVACAAPPSGFEHRVATLRAQAGIPGMAVTIVENDAVTFALVRLAGLDTTNLSVSRTHPRYICPAKAAALLRRSDVVCPFVWKARRRRAA